ncbi:MAG: hypothetical protein LC742_08635 [Acidobacteria bacterium]|nr:hypothetical protein [Acidobacteriota bacterium]
MAEDRSQRGLEQAIEEYIEIVGFLDGGLKQQVAFDLESLTRATGRQLSASEREKFIEGQHQANRWTFLGSGMTHPNFLATLESHLLIAKGRVEQLALAFC